MKYCCDAIQKAIEDAHMFPPNDEEKEWSMTLTCDWQVEGVDFIIYCCPFCGHNLAGEVGYCLTNHLNKYNITHNHG